MDALGNQLQSANTDLPELSEFNIKLYLGVKEFLATLSSFGESSSSDLDMNGAVKTH